MTTSDPGRQTRQPGYRGALRPRGDRLAAPWILTVFAIFVLIFLLSFLGVPSRFFPEPTLAPTPSVTATPEPSGSAEPSADASASESASPSASAEESAEASASAEESASP
jgi:hypothetical protein